MPALDFTTAQTTLNTIIGDSADTTFSSSEKQRALTKAWNDSYVVNEVWDTSLSYSTGVYQYTRPAGLSSIQGIYISVYTLKMLAHKKANLFTKNDVTMSELIGLKRDLQQDVVELRRRLRTAWESA
jgi:hypothetical protein